MFHQFRRLGLSPNLRNFCCRCSKISKYLGRLSGKSRYSSSTGQVISPLLQLFPSHRKRQWLSCSWACLFPKVVQTVWDHQKGMCDCCISQLMDLALVQELEFTFPAAPPPPDTPLILPWTPRGIESPDLWNYFLWGKVTDPKDLGKI